jgi:hypothetical protein
MENPVDPQLDVGKNSFAAQRVRRAFMHAHTAVSRGIRLWLEANEGRAGESSNYSSRNSGFHHRGGGDGGGGWRAPPPSLLACIVTVDQLLVERGAELRAAVNSAAADRLVVASSGARTKFLPRTPATAAAAAAAATATVGSASSSAAPAPGSTPSTAIVISDGDSGSSGESDSASKARTGTTTRKAAAAIRLTPATPADGQVVAAAAPLPAVTVAAMHELTSATAGSGIKLRHTRLLADIMTRKERNVNALAGPPPSWY